MTLPKLSIFFGAGAEIGYGLPSGGKFALEIFRVSNEEDKETFREQIQNIDSRSQIASQWLPDNYASKRLNVFGKGEFEGLIASSLENRRSNILDYLDKFDSNITNLLRSWKVSEDVVREKFTVETNEQIGDMRYNQAIRLNEKLATRVPLFESDYFSAFLRLLEKHPTDRYLKRIVRAYLELLVGAIGQSLVSQLNEELFTAAPDEISVFDDLSGIFSLNYQGVGQTGMEIVIEEAPIEVHADTEGLTIFRELGRTILEEIYCQAMDYQALIDSHFRYLYNPKAQWAKFSRIAIFLHTVQRYITNHVRVDEMKISEGPGYYHDLLNMGNYFELKAIGSTNYNNFVQRVIAETEIEAVPVFHLNGSVNEYYDPYKNAILTEPTAEDRQGRILVPFMFTQSGVKPLTSVDMSRKYVDLYDYFVSSDAVCVIGYGFNGDDGHINGMFRSLVEQENKRLFIFHYKSDNRTEQQLSRYYQQKLRLNSSANLRVYLVDHNRMANENIWFENILNELVTPL
ncbi:SIR2 family protein [Fictibacillus sp. 23RED33]|uniref:SIR2 family protein n=1 Tax=Fictibacillus sp. 23RED33 TaxID=2745879 RepID=UPI0018CD200E|nr:SIR2 family protein [Fictibacillus sp. 23RED33]MBH0175663.1 SIR2 family protein [Fictibacillus sp. 23RED33]